MSRRIVLIALLLVAAACGAPAEVAPTTTAVAVETPTTTVAITTTEPVVEETTTTTMADDHGAEGEHGDEGEHADEGEHGDDGDHGDDGHDDGMTAEGRVIEVVMTEFAFEPEAVAVTPGETVRFVVINEGAIEHELRLSNQHRVDEHIASGHEDHGDDGHHGEDADKLVLVPAGETGELVVEIPEDTSIFTLMACLIPGHYEAGMVGSLDYA